MYFHLKVCPPYAGMDEEFKFEASSKGEAEAFALEKAIEVYDSYGIDDESYAEENGCELEYDYVLREIPERLYLRMEVEPM
jgi:hypothetical protein